jgi:hypothetical protein
LLRLRNREILSASPPGSTTTANSFFQITKQLVSPVNPEIMDFTRIFLILIPFVFISFLLFYVSEQMMAEHFLSAPTREDARD